jgi:hypothetical protein
MKNDGPRKSINQNISSRPTLEPQDENNPKNRHFNFITNKELKQSDIKNQQTMKISNVEFKENVLPRNKVCAFPRTENSNVQHFQQQQQQKNQIEHQQRMVQ